MQWLYQQHTDHSQDSIDMSESPTEKSPAIPTDDLDQDTLAEIRTILSLVSQDNKGTML